MNSTNSCMIDVIAKEAALLNKAKLTNANVETLIYATVYTNTQTGQRTAHAEMIYFYKGDTWQYSNSHGSVRVYKNKISYDIETITKTVYSKLFPHLKVETVKPLDSDKVHHRKSLSCDK